MLGFWFGIGAALGSKRLAVHNHKKREEQRKEQAKLEKTASGVNQYYGIGAVIALGVIGGLGYYIYRAINRATFKPKTK